MGKINFITAQGLLTEVESLVVTVLLVPLSRFVPDKGFSGTDQAQVRDGPVQFERDMEEDPFGLNKFLTEAKKAKRPSEDSRDAGSSKPKRPRY